MFGTVERVTETPKLRRGECMERRNAWTGKLGQDGRDFPILPKSLTINTRCLENEK
jgi:hypothetical protein